jgi:hypothetical protein
MSVLLITYDLNKEVKRPRIVQHIKKLWPTWVKLSESSYGIHTVMTPDQVFAQMKPLLDGNDNLYVIPLGRPAAGQGSDTQNQWLQRFLLGQAARAA